MLVDNQMRQCLEDIINEDCVLTLSQINGELRQRLPAKPLIHDQTIAQNLEGMLFALNWFSPSQQTGTDLMFCKDGKTTHPQEIFEI